MAPLPNSLDAQRLEPKYEPREAGPISNIVSIPPVFPALGWGVLLDRRELPNRLRGRFEQRRFVRQQRGTPTQYHLCDGR